MNEENNNPWIEKTVWIEDATVKSGGYYRKTKRLQSWGNRPMPYLFRARERLIKTTDWWSGNFLSSGKTFYQEYERHTDGNEVDLSVEQWQGQEWVKVQILNATKERNLVRVLVKGTGDTAYEKDFKSNQLAEAIALYESLITLRLINFETVKNLGMTHI